jgi:hypothetical protein
VGCWWSSVLPCHTCLRSRLPLTILFPRPCFINDQTWQVCSCWTCYWDHDCTSFCLWCFAYWCGGCYWSRRAYESNVWVINNKYGWEYNFWLSGNILRCGFLFTVLFRFTLLRSMQLMHVSVNDKICPSNKYKLAWISANG